MAKPKLQRGSFNLEKAVSLSGLMECLVSAETQQNLINQKIDIRSTTLTSRAGVVGAMSVALNGIRNMAVNSSSHIDFGVTS
jgi:hypothetical protein